ncbi:MAG: hypothetical protein ACJAZO_002720 [Myxococcota bacterium]|jgi:hypothetical protein
MVDRLEIQMTRTFLLPLSALAVGATAWASEPETGNDGVDTEADATVLGVWRATSLTDFENSTYSMPYVCADTFGRASYLETWRMSLTVSAGSVALASTYDYVVMERGVRETSGASLTYNGAWSDATAPVYTLLFDESELNMNCTLAGDDLECVGIEEELDYLRISFDRDIPVP